jgi:hypothetical protein
LRDIVSRLKVVGCTSSGAAIKVYFPWTKKTYEIINVLEDLHFRFFFWEYINGMLVAVQKGLKRAPT